MKMLLIAAFAALCASQPAAATTTLGNFDIYASDNVFISGPGGYGDVAAGSFTNANGQGATNFKSLQAATAALTAQATALSDAYAAMATTGTFSSLYGAGTLTGAHTGINVYSLTATDLGSLWKLSFAGQGNGAIVNITGTGALRSSVQFDMGAIGNPANVVLNFVDVNAVWLDGLNLKGSILAPDAALRVQGNAVAGSVVSKSFHGEGVAIGGNGFSGFSTPTAAPPVPEPATWAMMIVGFGFVGSAMRRRRARVSSLARA